jgi:HrpA-like RNA helicase
MSISRRVSIEMGERKEDFGTVKSLVGYQVRLDNKTSATSALIYCTTVCNHDIILLIVYN